MGNASFLFYDLETSGLSARQARIMQFAGQRTDLALNPIGEPFNLLIKVANDTLPSPEAVLVTGITPQATIADGYSEAEFLRLFAEQVAVPGTVFVGYNTVRFDDEFMRYLHYRNFYDPYEWQWQDGRGKWDLLDVVRMTRALRPDGIEWPFGPDGKASNRLELLTALNKLDHASAHDALSDVNATIAVAKLIRNRQPKLFDYLLRMSNKRQATELVSAGQPFVYTSGRYSGDYHKTTVAAKLCDHPKQQGALVYNLRYDPAPYMAMSPQQLADAWQWKQDATEAERLPVKLLRYNRCPAIAPTAVLDAPSRDRIGIDQKLVAKHHSTLQSSPDFRQRLLAAAELMGKAQQANLVNTEQDVDAALYDGFFGDQDKQAMRVVRAAQPHELGDLNLRFKDQRLDSLLPLYKARNHAQHLTAEEREQWERYRANKLFRGGQASTMAKYLQQLQEIAARPNLTANQRYLLEELKLYAESIMPDAHG